MELLLQDLGFALRLLWKDRGFTLTALLTLALCIAANAAIFTVVHSVLMKPLPFAGADRLVYMFNSYPKAGEERAQTGVPDYFDRLREVDVFDEQALYDGRGQTLGMENSPERVPGMIVSPSFFRILQVPPYRGRTFHEDEAQIGNERKVILSYGIWQRLFGGRENVLGQEIRVNGRPCTIVGIMPKGFHFVDAGVEVWLPAAFTPEEKSDDSRHSNNWSMMGRLKPGATLEQAQQQIDALNQRNLERFPALKEVLINAGFHTRAVSLQKDLVADISRILYLLWGGVAFVLLIGCVNITNLVLVRSSGRLKEMATRHALGAGRGRIARQLLTETTLLTIAGGALGLLLGYWALGLLTALGIEELPRGSDVAMDRVVVAFIVGVSVLIGLVIGSVPLINIFRLNLNMTLREEGRTGTSGRGARLVRRTLVTAQVAFAFVLLIGAGLLLASFQKILGVKPGFDPKGLLTAMVAAPSTRYEKDPDVVAFASRALESVRRVPGIQSAAITTGLPFAGNYSDSVIFAEGYTMQRGESLISPSQSRVTPGYFETMRVPLVRGRFFTEGDTAASPQVIIVDTRLAQKFWPGADPIGKRMYQPDSAEEVVHPAPTTKWRTVVGVIGEVKLKGLVDAEDSVGAYYFPLAQLPSHNLSLVMRTAIVDPKSVGPAMRRAITAIDPELPVYSMETMEERMSKSLVSRRTPLLLALGFGAVALFLSAVGIYGVLAYQVAQRIREIGIRMALGSTVQGIFRLVLSEGLRLVGAGLAIGLIGAFLVSRAMASQLFGVKPLDPFVFGAVALVLGAVALVATLVPAQRATRINPVVALTSE